MTRRWLVRALGGGALGLLGAACLGTQAAAPGAPATGTPLPATLNTASRTVAPAIAGLAATVRITDVQITSAAGSYIAADRGYFREEGINAQFIPSSAPEQVLAVVTGSAAVAGTVINSQLYNALAQGLSLKVVADHGGNLNGASAGGFVVRKDLAESGQYKGVTDIKGWKVGVAAPGSTADIALDRFLHSGGLDLKEIEQITLGFPEMLAAFANGAIQGAYCQEPFTTVGVEQALCVRGPTGYDMYPGQQIAVLIFGQKLFGDRELSLHYVRAYTRGVRDYVKGLLQKDPAMFDIVVPILIAHTTVTDRSLFQRAIPSGLKSDPIPNVQSMQDDQDWLVQHGFVQQPIQVDQFVDLSFVQNAIRQLGRAA